MRQAYAIEAAYEGCNIILECETLPDVWDTVESIDKLYE